MARLALVRLGDGGLGQRDSLILAINGDNQVALAIGLDVGDRTGGVNVALDLGSVLADQGVGSIAIVLDLLDGGLLQCVNALFQLVNTGLEVVQIIAELV